jgi:hypothetical protein
MRVLAARRWRPGSCALIALLIESGWEIFENSPLVIERDREASIALGYRGDSVINSVSAIASMPAGFALQPHAQLHHADLAARRHPNMAVGCVRGRLLLC